MNHNAYHILTGCMMAGTLMAVSGCAGQARPAEADHATVTSAVTGVAGITAHTQSAQRHVQQAIPHTDRTGKVHLAAATDEHQEVIADAAETRHALDATATQITALEGQIVAIQGDYTNLESRWYVRWGRRVERALWVIGLSWLAAGALSVLFGLGNPLSLTWRIGKEITRLVPVMNPFSWVRDWILKSKESKA